MKPLPMLFALAAVGALQISAAQARPGDPTDWRQSRQENRIDQRDQRGVPSDWRQSRQENRPDQGYRRGDPTPQLPRHDRSRRFSDQRGAHQRLQLHLRTRARRLQHLRGREHLADRHPGDIEPSPEGRTRVPFIGVS